MSEEACKGCLYHRKKDQGCVRYTDYQTDTYARRELCRGQDYRARKPRQRTQSEVEKCRHDFVDSDGGFQGICKKCGEVSKP